MRQIKNLFFLLLFVIGCTIKPDPNQLTLVLSGDPKNLDPAHVNYLAFPNGIDQTRNIYMYTHEILNTILLRLTQHPIISYNMYFLIKLVLSGFFMFQLSNHISKNRTISFIIGCCYAFSPYFLNMSKSYYKSIKSM